MITGFNTDIDHNDRVFHIQTEDKGRDNPVVESLIYSRGEIIAKCRTEYAELAETGEITEDNVQAIMEQQHQRMIRDVRNGRYDADGPKPFGHQFITGRSLDRVVLDFLAAHCAPRPLRIEPLDDQVFYEGTRPTVRLRVSDRITGEVAAGVTIRVRLISTVEDPRELFAGDADADGYIEASFEIPDLDGADTALVLEVDGAEKDTTLRHLVERGRPPSSRPGTPAPAGAGS